MKTCAALSVSKSLNIHPRHAVWQVKSIHNEYLNLSTPEGLVTIIKTGNPLIPFGISVDIKFNWHSYGIREKQPVFQFPTQIVIDGVLAITDYNKCPRFVCRPQFDHKNDESELSRRIDLIYRRCLQDRKPGGILSYLDQFDIQYRQKEAQFQYSVESRIWPRFQSLVAGINKNNDDLILEGVRGLLGLGQGLTPSGDDFLLGFLCGLRELGVGNCLEAAEKMAHHLVTNALCLTTSLSAEYIRYGVKGLYHQLIIEFIEMFHMGSVDEMTRKVDTLMNLGHYSGTDLLTGFAYGGLTALHGGA
jgi:hypothetical protein